MRPQTRSAGSGGVSPLVLAGLLGLGLLTHAAGQSNWIPTDPARKFELMFRLYAPTKALFDKKWALPDVEKMS